MSNYKQFEFRTQPWFDQASFVGWNHAIPMKTLVIYCFDPRAAEIPDAVARYFGDEVYPGENIIQNGVRMGHTRTLFCLSNGGGRAEPALASIAVMDILFHLQKVVVVHHSFCGMTSVTPELVIDHFHQHHRADIAAEFDRDSLAIMDFEDSLKHDLKLLRASPAVPKTVKLYGFFYEINSGELTEVARDIPA